jgi:hypothetical protein
MARIQRTLGIGCSPSSAGSVSHRIEGLEVHPGSEPDSLTVSVNNGRRANFEVLSMSVLSQEKADELARLWLPSEELRDAGQHAVQRRECQITS